MIAFIQDHRGQHGVTSRDPVCASDRAKRDKALRPEVLRVWQENRSVYGARKLWHVMKREQFNIARCTVERFLRTRCRPHLWSLRCMKRAIWRDPYQGASGTAYQSSS